MPLTVTIQGENYALTNGVFHRVFVPHDLAPLGAFGHRPPTSWYLPVMVRVIPSPTRTVDDVIDDLMAQIEDYHRQKTNGQQPGINSTQVNALNIWETFIEEYLEKSATAAVPSSWIVYGPCLSLKEEREGIVRRKEQMEQERREFAALEEKIELSMLRAATSCQAGSSTSSPSISAPSTAQPSTTGVAALATEEHNEPSRTWKERNTTIYRMMRRMLS